MTDCLFPSRAPPINSVIPLSRDRRTVVLFFRDLNNCLLDVGKWRVNPFVEDGQNKIKESRDKRTTTWCRWRAFLFVSSLTWSPPDVCFVILFSDSWLSSDLLLISNIIFTCKGHTTRHEELSEWEEDEQDFCQQTIFSLRYSEKEEETGKYDSRVSLPFVILDGYFHIEINIELQVSLTDEEE